MKAITSRAIVLIVGSVLATLPCGCDSKTPGQADGLSDKPLAAFQKELLDIAFETATAIPVDPHIKDRSRAQQAVVAVCLELDQPQRALEYADRIDNWRRGVCYAELALYCAKQALPQRAQRCLEVAENIAGGDIEVWRRDRIRAKMAQANAWLGRTDRARELEASLADAESGKLVGVRAMAAGEADFEQEMQTLHNLVATGNFDATTNALRSYAQLFNRYYDSPERRSLIEQRIENAWSKIPLIIRIELLRDLADFALAHEDQAKALELVDEAQQIMDSAKWPPEHHVPLMARLAALRFRAGQIEKAQEQADKALELFESKRDRIVNIYRAESLQPLAEAYSMMSNTPRALAVYELAVTEGVANPNSRPRAEDLSATCCSMALHAVEPGAELWERIRTIHKGLGDPW